MKLIPEEVEKWIKGVPVNHDEEEDEISDLVSMNGLVQTVGNYIEQIETIVSDLNQKTNVSNQFVSNLAINVPHILHLNGPEYGVYDYTAPTNSFSNTNIGVYETDYHYDGQESMYYLASRGWRYVKIPIRWERIQGTINGSLCDSEVTFLTDFMDRCHNAGLKVIIDVHNYGIYYRNVNGTGIRTAIGDTELPISAFADLWRRLAIQYKDYLEHLGMR